MIFDGCNNFEKRQRSHTSVQFKVKGDPLSALDYVDFY